MASVSTTILLQKGNGAKVQGNDNTYKYSSIKFSTVAEKEILQTPFDKAFVEVVEYLSQNYQQHKKFRFKKDLFEKLRLSVKNWDKIKNRTRHVPEEKISHIQKVLVEEFDVRPVFLEKHKPPMFRADTPWLLNEPEAEYLTKDQLITKLQKELAEANKTIQKLQAQLIEALYNKV